MNIIFLSERAKPISLHSFLMLTIQSHNLTLLRKPSGIASTPGKGQSIFDLLTKKNAEEILQKSFALREKNRSMVGVDLKEHIVLYGTPCDSSLLTFTYDLLANRLDTPTSGYLLFAKSIAEREQFELDQKAESYQKYYLARVVGDIRYWLAKNPNAIIDFPIMHHQSLEDRMVCLQGSKNRGRGKPHKVSSSIEFLSFDEKNQTSIIKVMITKGIRHQIRVHCATIGYPIL
jgi:23S rRNA-/tRNA-specific pseudouridylate synthase